ncbi:hypothetical protein RND81_09G136600 [Saponaria officinalis]|uniref:SCP domain-containing protein n=1 Tax=Saponaria officinalis TaxID=3572 RepID=A0AAW1IMB0_SAPOF
MRLLSLCTFVTILSTISLLCRADEVQKQFLNTHNAARSQVGVAPLIWNNTLALFAETYVNKVKVQCDDSIKSGSPYGENIIGGYGAGTPEEAVNSWIGERDNYNYASNTCKTGSDCSHYKQIVWRNSVGVGCAIIFCGAGWPFVACEYYPPGNIPGQSPY